MVPEIGLSIQMTGRMTMRSDSTTNDEDGFLLHSSTMSTVSISPEGHAVKNCGSLPQSKNLLERELKVLRAIEGGSSGIFPLLVSSQGEGDSLSIKMTRLGTHDLSDVMHDLEPHSIPGLFSSMISGVKEIHDLGFVHRDIKPGNFMVKTAKSGRIMSLEGIIDFGLSLRINRKQNELQALGGTRPYSHPTQTSRKYSEMRAHPGQDWFALARTFAHLLIGSSAESLQSLIESGKASRYITRSLSEIWEIYGTKPPLGLIELLEHAMSPDSETEDSLQGIEKLGQSCAEQMSEMALGEKISSYDCYFQPMGENRPKRHDLLLIVDSTESMSDEIEDLRDYLEEASKEVSSKIDLRVDIWSLRDYSRDETAKDPVRVVGKRLRSEALKAAISQLDSDSEQLDEAEAYEAALQDAYLGNKWGPRINSTRTIIVIGDSYAHGWLTKHYWGIFSNARKTQKKKKEGEMFGAEIDCIGKYENFKERHPDILIPWKWRGREENEARKNAASNKKERDEYSSKGHVIVPSKKGTKKRANIHKSVERCVSRRNAMVHSIFVGSNLVSRSFMKYLALIGEGTYTEVSDGELKLALTGLFTVPDPELFGDFSSKVHSEDPDTEVLGSITSFITN